MERLDVVWVSEELGSAEHLTMERDATGTVLRGVVVAAVGEMPAHLRYEVRTDDDWRTERVEAEITGPRPRRFELEVSEGQWRVDGEHRPDLTGCIDVDLGWTPATNLLPIRRLAPAIGESVTVTAAWLRFPELDVIANRQTYTHLDTGSWRYRSGPYDFVLATTPEGIVTRYGDDLWMARTITTSHG